MTLEPLKHYTFHAYLISVDIKLSNARWTAEESITELSELCKTAGLIVKGSYIQQRRSPHRGSYIGKGAVEGLKTIIEENKIEVVIADDELSPSQQRHLEEELCIKINTFCSKKYVK